MFFQPEEIVNTQLIKQFILLAIASLERIPGQAVTEMTTSHWVDKYNGEKIPLEEYEKLFFGLVSSGRINIAHGQASITDKGLRELEGGPLKQIAESIDFSGFDVLDGKLTRMGDVRKSAPPVAPAPSKITVPDDAELRAVTFEDLTIRKVYVCYGDPLGDGSTRRRTAPCTTAEEAVAEAKDDMITNHFVAQRYAIVLGDKVLLIDSPVERELFPEQLIH